MGVLGAKEYGNGLAQANCEELKASLVIEIDRKTERLWESIDTIIATTIRINNGLLGQELGSEKNVSDRKEKAPEGWLETHLERLEMLLRMSTQILVNVDRLEIETKTKKK